MQRFALVLAIVLGGALNAQAVLVIGYAYLSGQSNHENIRVIFEAVSPSAETDTVYTGEVGAFSTSLEPGVYHVLYSHLDYANYNLPNQILLWNTNLDPVTLLPPLSGNISGTLGPGDFQVTDLITVPAGTSLTILPGTRLFFDGMHSFVVQGLLTAAGTEQDSIVFTRRYATGPDTAWGGIYKALPGYLCHLDHVIVEYASDDGSTPDYCGGAAFCCDGYIPNISIAATTFQHNTGDYNSSIVHFESCSPIIAECVFENNIASGSEGIVAWHDSYPTFESCTFQNNRGTALYGNGSSVGAISGCIFRDNTWAYDAGAIDATHAPVNVVRCLFVQSVNINRPLIKLAGVPSSLTKCTFWGWGDSDDGMILVNGTSAVSSCVLCATAGRAITFDDASACQIRFCDIRASSGGPFGYYGNEPSQGPPAIGLVALTNANGDSCDTYYNLFLDPQFADTANGDYHLTAGSPCIDAGDPELSPDPDGTVADIGAFYFDQLDAPDRNPTAVRGYGLLQNYPNPFNGSTQIVFDLPRALRGEVAVYDVTGRVVATPFSGEATAGANTVTFSPDNLPSGLYFCRLTAGDFRQTRKLVLIK